MTISAHLRMINFSRKGVFFRTGKRRFDITNCYIKTKLPLAILFQCVLAATSFAEATVVKKDAKGAKKWKTSDYA